MYYKVINGIRYDRSLLEAAERCTQGRGEWQISLKEIQEIYALATDATRITENEWQTLHYISQNFSLTQPAQHWLKERFNAPDEIQDFDLLMRRIVREEFGFKHLRWQISASEASRYNKNPLSVISFQLALRQALQAFLERGMNQLSLSAILRRRVLGLSTEQEIQQTVREYMENGGILFLVPDDVVRDNFDFDLPIFLNLKGFYYIGLHIPALSPVLFMAQGTRSSHSTYYHTGYISRRPDLQDLSFAVVRQLAQFTNLKYEFDHDEVTRQLERQAGQNFGEALFAALTVGIFNGESSFSFRDFIRQDIWHDPERPLDFYMRDYIETGTIHLLSPETGISDFKIPKNFVPNFEYDWVFGLEMPLRTDARFIITAQREGNLDASWNDGFLPETLSLEQQISQVLQSFDLTGLQVIASEAAFEAQRTQFGPDYRTFSSLLRQAINTILHDYLRKWSVFNFVAEVHHDEVSPNQFDDPNEFKAAVKHLIFNYLKTGTLEFLPIELPDNNPPDGEAIQEFWQFFGLLPGLSDVGFWIIIPRFPDDEQLPYCYGFN